MLFACVLSINATKKYADLSKDQVHGKGTWTASTKTFTWTQGYSAYIELIGLNGDLTKYTSLVVETANFKASYRVDFYYKDTEGKEKSIKGNDIKAAYWTDGIKVINLETALQKITDEQRRNITKITVNTNSGKGSVTINKAYLEAPLTSLNFVDGIATIDLTDLSVSGDAVAYDDQTGVVTSTGKNGKISISLPGNGIDLSEAGNIEMKHDGDITGYIYISGVNTYYNSRFNAPFSADDALGKSRNAVKEICWNINKAGTMTIKSVSLRKGSSTITVGTSKYATYMTSSPLDFTGADIKAYSVQVNGSTISYNQLDGKVPANTAILVYAEEAKDYAVPFTTYVEALTDNSLKGTLKKSNKSKQENVTADGTQYILANGNDGIGWYQAETGTEIAAGKAYLVIGSTSAKPFYAISSSATGINSVDNNISRHNDGNIYNLAGQRVGKNYKGIVINKGKKTIQK